MGQFTVQVIYIYIQMKVDVIYINSSWGEALKLLGRYPHDLVGERSTYGKTGGDEIRNSMVALLFPFGHCMLT